MTTSIPRNGESLSVNLSAAAPVLTVAGEGGLDALPALRRAAQRARLVAEQTGTDLIVVRDGQVVRVPPPVSRTK